ncbi:MAG: hypothetical protein WCO12_04150 [bacterium]
MESFRQQVEEDNIEGKVLNFDDSDMGKSTPVLINKVNDFLGSGDCSLWIASANVGMFKDTEGKHVRDIVLKRFRGGGRSSAEEELNQNYKSYKTLKAMGLPTFDTFRINMEHKIALMTLETKAGGILLTSNDTYSAKDKAPFLENPIKEIANLDDFVAKVKSILDKNVENNFCPEPASY